MVEHDRIKDADALTVPSGNMQITPSAMICQRFQNYFLIFGIVPKQKPQSGDFSLKIQSDCGLAPCIFCLCLFCPIILTFLLQQQCIKRLHRHRTVKQKALCICTTASQKEALLFLCFHSLNHDMYSQLLQHGNGIADNDPALILSRSRINSLSILISSSVWFFSIFIVE